MIGGYIWGQTWKDMGVGWNVLGFWVGGYGIAVDLFGLSCVVKVDAFGLWAVGTRGGCFWGPFLVRKVDAFGAAVRCSPPLTKVGRFGK